MESAPVKDWNGFHKVYFRFVGKCSAQSLTAKANAPLLFRSRSPVNQIPLFFSVYNEILE